MRIELKDVYCRFDGGPIRDFVPLLVKSAVRRELAADRRTLSAQYS